MLETHRRRALQRLGKQAAEEEQECCDHVEPAHGDNADRQRRQRAPVQAEQDADRVRAAVIRGRAAEVHRLREGGSRSLPKHTRHTCRVKLCRLTCSSGCQRDLGSAARTQMDGSRRCVGTDAARLPRASGHMDEGLN